MWEGVAVQGLDFRGEMGQREVCNLNFEAHNAPSRYIIHLQTQFGVEKLPTSTLDTRNNSTKIYMRKLALSLLAKSLLLLNQLDRISNFPKKSNTNWVFPLWNLHCANNHIISRRAHKVHKFSIAFLFFQLYMVVFNIRSLTMRRRKTSEKLFSTLFKHNRFLLWLLYSEKVNIRRKLLRSYIFSAYIHHQLVTATILTFAYIHTRLAQQRVPNFFFSPTFDN